MDDNQGQKKEGTIYEKRLQSKGNRKEGLALGKVLVVFESNCVRFRKWIV